MFRDKTHHEDHHRHCDEHGGCLTIAAAQHKDSEQAVADARKENGQADRQKNAHGRQQRRDLQDDQKETGAVRDQANLAFPDTAVGFDRHVRQAVSLVDNAHGDGRGIGERVGQHGNKLAGNFRFDRPEARGQVLYFSFADIGREKVVEAIGHIPMEVRFRVAGARPDNHVIPADFLQHRGNVFRIMLAVAVHHYKDIAFCLADARLDGRAVADIVRVRNHAGAGVFRPQGCFIR